MAEQDRTIPAPAPSPGVPRHPHPSRCPNCDTELRADDVFCPHCGQESHDLRVPFKHLALEAAEGLLHFDSKSYRTLKALVLHPGFLSREFSAGRRTRYVAPLRLYVFVSFLFFFLLSLGSGAHEGAATATGGAGGGEGSHLNISLSSIKSEELRGLSTVQIDSLMGARGIARTTFNRFMAARLAHIAGASSVEFNHLLLKGVSYMMFVLMPLFALIVFVFYRRQTTYYIECLAFSLHFHSFAFLVLILWTFLSRFTSSLTLALLAVPAAGVYLFLALRIAYGQPALLTALKTFSIGLLHLFSFAGCFMLTVLASILLF
jgi:hypothetical protein